MSFRLHADPCKHDSFIIEIPKYKFINVKQILQPYHSNFFSRTIVRMYKIRFENYSKDILDTNFYIFKHHSKSIFALLSIYLHLKLI